MALDSGNVRLAPTGHLYVAPYGTALPGTATVALNAAFKEFGYLDENGVAVTPNVDTNGISAWQTPVDVVTVLNKVGVTAKFALIEITQTTTSEFFFGLGWTNYFGQGKLDLSSSPTLALRSLVIDWTGDDTSTNRLVLDRCVLTDHGDFNLQRTSNTSLEVTYNVLDNSGTLGRIFSTNPDLIPST